VRAAIRPQVAWPVVLVLSAAAAGIVAVAAVPAALATPVVLWFVLVCPGMALVRLLRLADPVAELGIGIALSAALATLVSGALLYAGAASPRATLAILATATVGGAVAQWRRRSG
jgi:hypothetical protein